MRTVIYNWLLLSLCLLVNPAAAEQSLLMPRASEALLLDATQVGKRLLVVGDHGHILYSDDGADSWQQANVPTRAMLTAVHFPSHKRGWAVGHDGLILATSDGGEHWSIQRDGLAEQSRLNRERLRAVEREITRCRSNAASASSHDKQERVCDSFSDLEMDLEDARLLVSEPVHAPPLLDVFFVDDLRGVAVGAFNTLLRTVDGGVTWELLSSRLDNPDELHLNAITGAADGRLWIAAEGGLLFTSDDAGGSWRALGSPYYGSWFGIVRSPGSGTLLAFGLRGTVYRSVDDGRSWQSAEVDTERTLAGGEFVSASYALLVGGVGTLLVSDDAGASFTSVSSGTRHNLSAVTIFDECALLVGQGGVHCGTPFGAAP